MKYQKVTKTTKATSLDWKLEKGRLAHAAEQAEEILHVAGLTVPPIDPFAIAAREKHRLKLIVDDFKNRFDGQIEYSKEIRRFLCFLNSKYDRNLAPGAHHPRTRFSLAHELAHYYLDPHAGYLIAGGKPHGSRGEFERDAAAEREADAFAAALLMPSDSFGPNLNAEEPSLRLMSELASKFQTSLTSTLFRAVQLTDFPAAFVGINKGAVAWCFPSEALIEAGCYPPPRGPLQSTAAKRAWEAFASGTFDIEPDDSAVGKWFRTYNRDYLADVYVHEEYVASQWSETLFVLLSISEAELMDAQGDEEDEDDKGD